VEDKLFATLDPTTRKLAGENKEILLIDTVGFIRKLPTGLIEAFKSTLEEAVYADILVHVVDSSDTEYEEHIQIVNETLISLGVTGKPILIALNKIDLLENRGTGKGKGYRLRAYRTGRYMIFQLLQVKGSMNL